MLAASVPLDPTFIGVIGAATAALVGWLAQAYRLGGKVKRTDAEKLWDESAKIREYLRGEIDRLEVLNGKLESRNRDLESRVLDLEKDNSQLRRTLDDLDRTVKNGGSE